MSFPPRGTGLARGTARPRRWPPLTEAQRMARHKAVYKLGNGDTAFIVSIAGALFGALLIGVCMTR